MKKRHYKRRKLVFYVSTCNSTINSLHCMSPCHARPEGDDERWNNCTPSRLAHSSGWTICSTLPSPFSAATKLVQRAFWVHFFFHNAAHVWIRTQHNHSKVGEVGPWPYCSRPGYYCSDGIIGSEYEQYRSLIANQRKHGATLATLSVHTVECAIGSLYSCPGITVHCLIFPSLHTFFSEWRQFGCRLHRWDTMPLITHCWDITPLVSNLTLLLTSVSTYSPRRHEIVRTCCVLCTQLRKWRQRNHGQIHVACGSATLR